MVSRTKNVSKIKFYGPLASALSLAVYCGNKKKASLPQNLTVYRGAQLPSSDLETIYQKGRTMRLKGFTSTSLDRATALKFALETPKPETSAVLIEIDIYGDN